MLTCKEKLSACYSFFEQLSELLKEEYEVVGSCNHDASMYLIPKGTIDLLTYYGKPPRSFRVSDHWNWYASLIKCDKPWYIQCLSVDMPWAKKRPSEGAASTPIRGCQVAIYGDDEKYHHIFGECFNRAKRIWQWEDTGNMGIKDYLALKQWY